MKTLIQRFKSPLFLKYMLSYLFVFIVPFTVMSIIIYQNTVLDLREQATDAIENRMAQAERYTTERMKELDQIAVRISGDYQLTPFMAGHDYYSQNAISQLKNYKANSAVIRNIYLYYHNDKKVYSTDGSYDLTTLLDRVYPFTTWTMADFQSHVSEETNSMYLSKAAEESGSGNMLISTHPIPKGNPNPYGTVLYTLKESALKLSVENILNDFKGNSYILNASNQVVTASKADQDISPSFLEELMNDYDESGEYTYQGKTYYISIMPSDYNNWQVAAIVNVNEFDQVFFSQKLLVISFLVLLFFAGLVTAFILGDRHYRPIQHLSNQLSDTGKLQTTRQRDELNHIHTAITDIFESNKALNSAIDLQKPYAREQILLKLLKGHHVDEEDVDHLFDLLNIQMYKQSYMVAILQIPALSDDGDQLTFQDQLMAHIETMEIQSVSIHAVDSLDDAIALIISTDYQVDQVIGKRQEINVQISNSIYHQFGLRPNISVGLPCANVGYLNRSYIEAMAAMNNHDQTTELTEASSITYFQSHSLDAAKTITYPVDDLTKLTQSIKQGNQEVANEVLDDIFASLKASNMKVNYLNAVYFDIVNTVIKTILELDLAEEIEDIEQLVDLSKPRQLKKELQTMINRVCSTVNTKKSRFNVQLIDDITHYIEEHYKTYDMSLEKMAAHFDFSVPYLSRFIKEHFTSTFSHYVFSLRLEDAKEQLRTTDKLIKTIITDVGYRDVSNFIREFKKVEGLTPGQYRKTHSK